MEIDYREVGKRIAKRRKELGLKQYMLCEMINVNYKYISNLETGRSAPSLELIMSLSEALGTTPDYFLMGTEIKKNQLTDRILADKISKLNAEDKLILSGIIDLFIENR